MDLKKKYYLGLDIGSDSVGFCVTDQDYNIVKKHKIVYDGKNTKSYGNHVWGARLFEEASDASARRMAREARRRYQRRKWRIVLLQDIFRNEMDKVDPNFFVRLNNSAIHNEDRDEILRQDYLLFNGDGQTDKEFYKKYPTIYHLRDAMIEHPEMKFDLREIYLALAHMVKYRGNFLHEGEMNAIGTDPNDLKNLFDSLDSVFATINENGNEENDKVYDAFGCTEQIAQNLMDAFKSITRVFELSDAMVAAFKLTALKSTDFKRICIDLIAGRKKNLSAVFPEVEFDEEGAKTSIEFSSEAFMDETVNKLPGLIGEERTQILLILKEIFDLKVLVGLLKGQQSVSKAMIGIYDTHNSQLRILKDLVKRYAPNEYSNFFRKLYTKDSKGKKVQIDDNYASYVGMNDIKGRRERVKHGNVENFYKRIGKMLPLDAATKDDFVEKQLGDKKKLNDIKTAIESKNYLPRQNSKENGVLPYQLNLNEMRIILKNQSQYYPFLAEQDKDFNNPERLSYKIESILKFKIPYFVGPLSDKANNQWIKKNSDERITPWNFHDVINEDKTAEAFMENLRNYCTYLINEPTLPKDSLIYQMFVLLNEMNKWKINGEYISVKDKEYLIKEVYLKKKKVTKKLIEEALKAKYSQQVTLTSSGTTKEGEKGVTNEDLHASLSSWIDLMDDRAFGSALLSNKDKTLREKAEKIIYDIATFENQTLMVKRLKKYGLTDRQIKYISGLKFKDWARLSNKLLTGLTQEMVNTETGELVSRSIMDLMWITNQNFMEILTSKDDKGNYRYDFMPQIEQNTEENGGTLEDIIQNTYASPIMKRALHQTIKVVEELKEKLGIDHFDSYFVESTRAESKDKKRTKSRRTKILEMYQAAAKKFKQEVDLDNLTNTLKNQTESNLKGKKIYLYFMQLGKSVYTGKEIPLDELATHYDIDHIIPQSKVKDDSFMNTVLVEKDVNNTKSDSYPIPKRILTKEGREWVEKLSKINPDLMPEEKKKRILRSENKPLTNEEISGFVQRQLVATSQSVKAVCEVLKKIDPKAKVVYSKAKTVSEFRAIFNLPKSRDCNDFHHAHDAYLNIVVGNVYDKIFSSGSPSIIEDKLKHFEGFDMNTEYIFKHNQHMIHTDSLVWKAKKYENGWKGDEIPGSEGTIDKVRKYLGYQDPMVTYQTYVNIGKQGFFNKISLHTAKDGDAAFPLKATGPMAQEGFEKKYGGYSDLINPYASLVESEGKKKTIVYSLEFIPSVARMTLGTDTKKLEEYLEKHNGLKNPHILIEKILMKSILEIPYKAKNGKEGYVRLGITGKSKTKILCINLSELHIPSEYMVIVKKISTLLGTNSKAGEKVETSAYEQFGNNDIKWGKTKLTREELLKLFTYITEDVYCRPEYEGLPQMTINIERLKNLKSTFNEMSSLNQMRLISLMIKATNCKSVQGLDFHEFGTELPSRCGDLATSKNLSKGTRIIQTSVTGLTEKVLFTVPEK